MQMIEKKKVCDKTMEKRKICRQWKRGMYADKKKRGRYVDSRKEEDMHID